MDRHGTVTTSTSSQPLDPPHFSLPTTFNKDFQVWLVISRSHQNVHIEQKAIQKYENQQRTYTLILCESESNKVYKFATII